MKCRLCNKEEETQKHALEECEIINETCEKVTPNKIFNDIDMEELKSTAKQIEQNQSLITGIFPDSMKITKVIPLYKKEDRELPDNYRPVSLLNAMSKIFERAAYNQLYKYFQDNDLFYKHQYGFRTSHSTELASIEFIDQIFDDLNKKK